MEARSHETRPDTTSVDGLSSTPDEAVAGGVETTLLAPPSPRRRRSRLHIGPLTFAVLALVVLSGVGAVVYLLWGTQEAEGSGLLFVIPAGAAEAMEYPVLEEAIPVPTRIEFQRGETAVIRVRNDDSVLQRAGPFLVNPGQTYTARFPEPGEYPISCSYDPADSVTVIVKG